MSLLASFIAALERTGGERLVLRSGEPPHLLVGDTRRDLGTATVSNKALAALTAQILSPEAQRTFAKTNAADEPLMLAGSVSASLFVEARRSGSDASITLRRIPPQPAAPVVAPAPAAAVVEPARPVSLPPAPAEPVAALAKPAENAPAPDGWEPIDLAVPSLKVAAVVELKPAPAADHPVPITISEPLPERATVSPIAVAISTVAVVEPVPEPAAVPPTAGPISIVASPPQEPKAAVVDAVPAKTVPACRPDTSALEYWIREAARREATALYLLGGQPPFVCVREQVEQLTGDPLDGSLVEAVTAAFAANDDEWRSASNGEWVREYDGVGQVRCQAFTDEVGPGLVVHLSAQHAASAAALTIAAVVEPDQVPAAEEPMGIVAIPEPPPEPAAIPPTSGPTRIVAFPPQEPKADGVSAHTDPACPADTSALEYWIREASRRDATALYLRGGQAPVMRIRERVEQLTGDPLDGSLVEGVTAAFAANDDEWRSAPDGEWVREYDGIGEVRCQAFTDELGPGLVVHLSAQHGAYTLQKYIPRQVRRACEEDDGIVLVSAEAAPDVLAMVAAVAEWTAQRRAGYLISVEPPNGLGHDLTGTFVSARRIDGTPENVAAGIRQAAQQRPDILVVALPSGIAVEEAIRAARPGCLMILGVVAPTAPRALESLLSLVDPQVEPEMRRLLAAGLRCAFSYRALRRIGGGRTIVHDALIATREVRAGLGRWDFDALDKLQRSGAGGMRSLDAALAGAVHRREISLRQAAMHASDRGEVIRLVRQASRERVRMSRERPGLLRAVAGASGTQPL